MEKLILNSNTSFSSNLSANRLIKGVKSVACNDPALITFINKLARASYYCVETGNFVLDISRWHVDGDPTFKACWTENVETSDFYNFFYESLSIYHSYLFFKENIPFLVDDTIMERVHTYVISHRFSPPHMEIIDNVPDEFLSKTEGQNVPPVMLPEIPLLLAAADEVFLSSGVPDYVSVSATCFGMRDQFTNSVVTGVSSKGFEANLSSMAMNRGDVDDISNETLISGVLMLMHDSGASNQARVSIEVPDEEQLCNLISTYKTGTGIVPAVNYVVNKIYSNGLVETERKKPRTKKALAKFLSKLITDTLQELYDSGERRDRVFPGVSVCVSSRKFEILNAVESLNIEELESIHSKLRIFFVESAHCIFLSYIAMKGLFEFLSRNGWEAGTLLNDGGFFDIFRRHACGTHGYDEDKFKAIYEKYPILKPRTYFEGDVTKFDQSLLYRVLAFVGIFFATWYCMKNNFNVTIMGNVIFRLMFKYLYIVPLSQLYAVKGMMFSGTFETSHGDTAYQMICFFCYLSYKLDFYKDHEYIQMLRDAIDCGLVEKSFLGDDTLLSWPTVFILMFCMSGDDYKKYALRFGLRFKYFFTKPLYGVVSHTKFGSVWKTQEIMSGVTFLKNSMCFNYDVIDGVSTFVGFYPYRKDYDLGFRFGNSDKANATIDGFMAKLISVAYLSIGNRQIFEYARILYSYSLRLYGKPFFDKDRLRAIMKGSGALYNLIENLDDFEFPEFSTIRIRHDKHQKKPHKAIVMSFGTATEIKLLAMLTGMEEF